MFIKIIFVVLGTILFCTIGLGICQFIESIVLRKKSNIQKYLYFRAIIDNDYALDKIQKKVSNIFKILFRFFIPFVLFMLTRCLWIGALFQISTLFIPYFLSVLVLRRDEDLLIIIKKELVLPFIANILASLGALVFYVIIIPINYSNVEIVYLIIGYIASLSEILLAIWIALGGPGKLIKKWKKKLSKIKLPKFKFKLPSPIPQN